ncbi:hypothetical protein MTR67_001875 [Solanum verrucosum]|uniref:Uncharacterized protein n=1 Tax=Solanum verrucosum TaxID=315347 RepID=A0AAF0PSM4_SOLVR|nr:hypothetical protein MTR67_001875 [Solanum verrucosum]
MRGFGHCDLLVTESSVAGAVEDGDGGHKKLVELLDFFRLLSIIWNCLLQSSPGPKTHLKPKVGAAGDIIYSLLLKSGLLTLHELDV